MAVQLDPALRPAVGSLCRTLLQAWPHGRELVKWVEPHNLHLTVKFLGPVPEHLVPRLSEVLEVLESFPSFRLHLVGLGAFPRARGARVLWIGIQEGAEQLGRLARRVEEALEPLGFTRERRPYSPHLTIGRLRTPAYHPELEAEVTRAACVEVGFQDVHSVELMESTLRPQGPVYTVVRSYPLRERG